jgi:hypothetical protein
MSQPSTINAEQITREEWDARGRAHEQAQAERAHLTGAQMDMIQKKMIAEFQRTVDDVEKRKEAMEMAVRLVETNGKGAVEFHDPIKMAREIHKFLMEPAAEIVVKVS